MALFVGLHVGEGLVEVGVLGDGEGLLVERDGFPFPPQVGFEDLPDPGVRPQLRQVSVRDASQRVDHLGGFLGVFELHFGDEVKLPPQLLIRKLRHVPRQQPEGAVLHAQRTLKKPNQLFLLSLQGRPPFPSGPAIAPETATASLAATTLRSTSFLCQMASRQNEFGALEAKLTNRARRGVPGDERNSGRSTMMKPTRIALLLGLVCLIPLLTGCPGAPGGQQNMPPGVLPPPGLESGGARTLMGTTITAPDNYYLLIKYTCAHLSGQEAPPRGAEWQSCRRVIPLDSCIMVEGLNYDGRQQGAEKDVNQLLPFSALASFYWKYEAKPTPPASEQTTPQGRRPRR